MSPRTRTALTAEPGTKGSGCFSLLAEPTPITGVIPALAKSGANCLRADALNPSKTKGASIGWRYCAKPGVEIASCSPGVLVLVAANGLAEASVAAAGIL